MRVGVLMRFMDKIGGSESTTLSLLRVLQGAGHDVTLYTNAPPRDVPAGVSVAVPDRPVPPAPPPRRSLLGRFDFYRGGHEGLLAMSDDDVLFISDWAVFMEKTRARRILYYFHLPPVLERETVEASLLCLPPRKWPRFCYRKHLVRRRMSRFDWDRVVLVPNSIYAGRIIEAAFGRRAGPVLYPPVGVGMFQAHAGRPKQRRAVTVANYWEGKRHDSAMRIARAAGVGWVSIGATVEHSCERLAESLRGMTEWGEEIRTNLSHAEVVEAVSSSRVYLHAADESFGIAVVEAMAAGCVPIVPNRTATVETVPFEELRFDTEEEAAEKVRAAADGKYDRYLAPLAEHAKKFSEEAFADRVVGMVGGTAGDRDAPAGA